MSGATPDDRRLPIEPLVALLERRHGGTLSDAEAGNLLGVNPDSFGRWRRRGWVREREADALGAELVGHPCLIWPEWHGITPTGRDLEPV